MNIKKAKDEIKNTVRAYLKKDADGEYIYLSDLRVSVRRR